MAASEQVKDRLNGTKQTGGYRATQLLAEDNGGGRYMPIDERDSREDFERFRFEYADDFDELDASCAALTSREE